MEMQQRKGHIVPHECEMVCEFSYCINITPETKLIEDKYYVYWRNRKQDSTETLEDIIKASM